MRFCGHCGNRIDGEARFCGACGAALSPASTASTQQLGAVSPSSAGSADASVNSGFVDGPPPAQASVLVLDDNVDRHTSFPPQRDIKPRKRLSTKWIVALVALGVLMIGGIIAFVVVQNIIRGGAATPEEAAQNLVSSVNDEDLVGLFTMLPPRERDALMRTQESLTDKVEEFGILEAANAVGENTDLDTSSELTFDGVDLQISGAVPAVTPLSDDYAVVSIPTGSITVSVDPNRTSGILGSLTQANPTDFETQTVQIADLGPNGSGLSLIASRSGGRWYLSPLLSSLEAANVWSGQPRGALPETMPTGSDSPAGAAEAAVVAAQRLAPFDLAPHLVREEAAALYLYGHLVNDFVSEDLFSIETATFTDGPRTGTRALAFLESVEATTSQGDRISMTSNCVADPASSEGSMCLNGSGYSLSSGSPMPEPMSMLAVDGKFSLTAVEEEGSWKISVLDTAVDHAISWVNSLTRQQALALADLERADEAAGTLEVGSASNLSFNSAGYAVATLNIDESQRLQFEPDSTVSGAQVYSADGKESFGEIYIESSGGVELPVGDYKVVVTAGSDWEAAYKEQGSDLQYASDITVSKYLEPALISGTPERTGYVNWFFSDTESHWVRIPEGGTQILTIRVTTAITEEDASPLAVFVDGERYEIPAAEGTEMGIPVPADGFEHNLEIVIEDSSIDSVDYELYYAGN